MQITLRIEIYFEIFINKSQLFKYSAEQTNGGESTLMMNMEDHTVS